MSGNDHSDGTRTPTPTPTHRGRMKKDSLSDVSFDLEAADSTTNLLVGSPDQLPFTSPSRSSGHDFAGARRPRPTMGQRSSSSPFTFRQRATTPTSQAGPSSFKGFGLKPTEQEWTVFGQLMENETPLPRTRTSNPTHAEHKARSLVASPENSLLLNEPYLEVPEIQVTSSSGVSHRSSRASSIERRTPEDDTAYDSDSSTQSDYDSDDTEETTQPSQAKPSWWRRIPELPPLYRNILKCSLAYFLASLFTYNEKMSHLIGAITSYGPGSAKPSPSGHLVASM